MVFAFFFFLPPGKSFSRLSFVTCIIFFFFSSFFFFQPKTNVRLHLARSAGSFCTHMLSYSHFYTLAYVRNLIGFRCCTSFVWTRSFQLINVRAILRPMSLEWSKINCQDWHESNLLTTEELTTVQIDNSILPCFFLESILIDFVLHIKSYLFWN